MGKGRISFANAPAYSMVVCRGYRGRRRCAHRCGGQGVMLHLLGVVTESVDPMERACAGQCSVMSTASLQDKTWEMHVAGRCESGERASSPHGGPTARFGGSKTTTSRRPWLDWGSGLTILMTRSVLWQTCLCSQHRRTADKVEGRRRDVDETDDRRGCVMRRATTGPEVWTAGDEKSTW